MLFTQAFDLMKAGHKVKLPSWSGYWAWENETIMMHTKEGQVVNFFDTDRPHYTLSNLVSDEWIVADEENTPILGGTSHFDFGTAIKYVKRGLKVCRSGWNGKKQYIEIAKNISYTNTNGSIVNSEHEAIGNAAIAFIGTSGVQLGWLASQADMLANDWMFAE